MTDKEIVERAKEAEKRTGFGELVHSPISKGVNSAFGIGFVEGMVEYRNSLQEEPVSEIDFEQELYKAFGRVKDFTLGMQIAKWFYDMGKNSQEPVSEDLEKVVEEIVDPTVLNAYGVKEIANRLRRTMIEPVSKDLEEVIEQLAENARKHKAETSSPFFSQTDYRQGVIDGAEWQKENLWKDAQGDDLPEIDREVIAILDNGKVVFAHRPPEFWDGKDIVTGKVTRYYPKTYDKGGWNIPNVKYWLNVELPKEIEL